MVSSASDCPDPASIQRHLGAACVRHQTPQPLSGSHGLVVWSASHFRDASAFKTHSINRRVALSARLQLIPRAGFTPASNIQIRKRASRRENIAHAVHADAGGVRRRAQVEPADRVAYPSTSAARKTAGVRERGADVPPTKFACAARCRPGVVTARARRDRESPGRSAQSAIRMRGSMSAVEPCGRDSTSTRAVCGGARRAKTSAARATERPLGRPFRTCLLFRRRDLVKGARGAPSGRATPLHATGSARRAPSPP